jgi:hypothetical protein
LGGELVLVSACLTVTPPITGGQEHTIYDNGSEFKLHFHALCNT